MTDPDDPTRLRDLDPLLRQAFDTARSEQPSRATLETMIRAVERATLAPAVPGESLNAVAPKVAFLKSQAMKVILIAGVSSGLLWTLPALQTPAADHTSPPPSPAAPQPVSTPATREPSPSEQPVTSHALERSATSGLNGSIRSTHEAKQRARAHAGSRRRGSDRGVAAVDPASRSVTPQARERDLQRASAPDAEERGPSIDELTLLEEAQRALRNSPERALELTDQHERAYPQGTYVQEREQIAIEALFNAGRSAEMRDRAARFQRAFRNSAHNARISELLELLP